MISLEQLKESSWYQFMAEEAQKDAQEKVQRDVQEKIQKEVQKEVQKVQKETQLKDAAMMLRKLAAKRFPDLQLGEEVDRIHDVDALQRLCLEVSDLPDLETLKRRIAELVKAEEA